MRKIVKAVLWITAGVVTTAIGAAADENASSYRYYDLTEVNGGETLPEAPDFSEAEISGIIAAENVQTAADSSEKDVHDDDFRDFVTRSEFEAAVSNLSWKKGPFTITPYGFLWADMAWNSSRCVTDGYCLYALSDSVDDSPGIAVDARMTRLGAMIDGPGFPGNNAWKTKGVLEADFEGQVNSTRNKGQLQLRKAYVELVNTCQDLRLAFGQDWDITSPLAPQMLNYLPAGFAGNIGYRRCQFRVEKGIRHSADCKSIWQISAADSFAGDYTSMSGVSAEAGGWPIIEGRFALKLGEYSRCAGPVTLGVSGHIGEETYIFSPISGTYADSREREHVQTWSFNFDGDVPLTKWMSVLGEYFYGADLSSFCGGINQGVDLFRRDSVRAQGGWIALHTKLSEKLTNNSGCGIDKPDEDDLHGTSAASNGTSTFRTRNELFFTNFFYQWNKALMTGLELGYWKTDWSRSDVSTSNVSYEDMDSGKTFRVDCAVQYLF